jgi:BirA family biotin operon repressor/biotin-[acetyl-CoA-carboxylase] ligase
LSSFVDGFGARYDGVGARELEAQLAVPRLLVFEEVGSTLDVAHTEAARGAPAGTVIVADAQSAGRGRLGRSWASHPGAGVWLTIIERPESAAHLDAVPLRVGIELAPALDRFADERIQLKWPNDLYVRGRKLAGVLAEARWRDGALDWLAIGVGINVRAPDGQQQGIGLRDGTLRRDVLAAAVPAVRRAASRRGPLTTDERAQFAERDLAIGRRCSEPLDGRVAGIDEQGALLIDVGDRTATVRAGSLVITREDAP